MHSKLRLHNFLFATFLNDCNLPVFSLQSYIAGTLLIAKFVLKGFAVRIMKSTISSQQSGGNLRINGLQRVTLVL